MNAHLISAESALQTPVIAHIIAIQMIPMTKAINLDGYYKRLFPIILQRLFFI